MNSVISTIIIVIVVLVVIIVVLFVVDFLSKRGLAKKPPTDANKHAATANAPVGKGESISEPEIFAALASNENNLADEMEAMIAIEPSKPSEANASAAMRSRIYDRRARMLEYHEKKYKSRSMSFDDNFYKTSSMNFEDSFDEAVDGSSITVDGTKITKEDIKKLGALSDFLSRKKYES